MGLLELRQFIPARNALSETEKLPRTEWSRGTRVEVDIAIARIDASLGSIDSAVTRLERVLAETNKSGLLAYGFEARMALAEIHLKVNQAAKGEAELQQVEREATARGFGLIERKAGVIRATVR